MSKMDEIKRNEEGIDKLFKEGNKASELKEIQIYFAATMANTFLWDYCCRQLNPKETAVGIIDYFKNMMIEAWEGQKKELDETPGGFLLGMIGGNIGYTEDKKKALEFFIKLLNDMVEKLPDKEPEK